MRNVGRQQAAEHRIAVQYSFSRGEAGMKIGSSQPIFMTEEEYGQKGFDTV